MCIPIQLLSSCQAGKGIKQSYITRAIPTFCQAINIAQIGDIGCLFMILQQHLTPVRNTRKSQ